MTASKKIEQSKLKDVLDAVKKGEEGSRLKLAGLTFPKLGVNEAVIKKLEQQAKKGDTEAMWKLGLCKEFEIGTKEDKKEAETLYETSSEGGNPTGVILAMNNCDCDNEDEEYDEEGDEYYEGEGEVDDDDENKYYDEYDEDGYDDRFDDAGDAALEMIDYASKCKRGWGRPMKGVNVTKIKIEY